MNLLISLQGHLQPEAPLFNIKILPNGAFSGNKPICESHSTSRAFYFFFAQIQILHIPAPSENSCLASRITQELNDIKVGGCSIVASSTFGLSSLTGSNRLCSATLSHVGFFGIGGRRMQ